METRNADQIFLIGHYKNQIVVYKLPCNGQGLRFLFYNFLKVILNLRFLSRLRLKEKEVFFRENALISAQYRKVANSIPLVAVMEKVRTKNSAANGKRVIRASPR